MANIIIRKKFNPSERRHKPMLSPGTWSKQAQEQYKQVSKENQGEFKVEKRIQELARGGFNEAAISGMTGHSESSVKKLMENTGKNIHLDGKL